ncbi:MAG: DNA polymerase III subunit delta' [Rhizobium sp.]|nr:DNA polymerase III subunit delta' [Rhizobium sp.]
MSADTETLVLDGAVHPAANTRLFGHRAAEEFLTRSYKSGKGHHAVLIEGPEGIGKATLAFRFANHVLAHPDPQTAPESLADPDQSAPFFRQIVAGASHNLLHITRPFDAKTGKFKTAITVDEVRRAGKFFSQTSGTQSWRIVIVDPADDMNRSAANAILKMLEEPPKRSMFLVISHVPGRLLPTIRSRCLPLVLRPLDEPDLRAALLHLGLAIPSHAEARLVSAARGSVSQAIKLVNYGGLDILDAFENILRGGGAEQRKAMHKIADAVSARGSDILYDFFVSLVGERVTDNAKLAAQAGDLDRAFRLSNLHASLAERMTVSDAYNLDRKQTVLGLLTDLAAAL